MIDSITHRTTVQTPGYPKDYCDNLDCVYDLDSLNSFTTGTSHSALKLTFDFFDMENNVDYITLSDMRDTNPRLLMGYLFVFRIYDDALFDLRYTGAMLPGTVFTFNYHKAQIKLRTDLSVVRKGFNATVEEIERDNCKW